MDINPETNQQYYAGDVDDVLVFCKSLNVDKGRLATIKPVNVISYMQRAEGIINGYLTESYFLPIKPYNQVDVNGNPHLVFPQRLRVLAQELTAGLMMISEFQSQDQNMNEAGTKLIEQAKKEIYQMTLWNHRIPGQKWKSTTSHTMPPGFEPPHTLVEQLWQI